MIRLFQIWEKNIVHYRHPETYNEELNLQTRAYILPTSFLCIFTWLPFVVLDHVLFPDISIIIFLRIGFSLIGMIVFLFTIYYFFFKRTIISSSRIFYKLMVMILMYLCISAGIIVGLTRGNPVYLSGLGLVAVIICLCPIKRIYLLGLLLNLIISFGITGTINRMDLSEPENLYALFNFNIALVFSLSEIFLLDLLRKNQFEKSVRIQKMEDAKREEIYVKHNITDREKEIIELLLRNKTNREIEAELYISYHTVKNHKYNIIKKLGVKNITEMYWLLGHPH